MKLKSRQNSEKVRLDVLKAGNIKFNYQQNRQLHKVAIHAIYEHSKWWLIIHDFDANIKYIYSVVDAKPGLASTDIDLDLIKETEF